MWRVADARGRQAQMRLSRAVELNHSGPKAFAPLLPDNLAAEQVRDQSGRQIIVEAKITGIHCAIEAAEEEAVTGRMLGRKDEPDGVASTGLGSALNLAVGEVVDGGHGDGVRDVTELGLCQFIGCRPRSEHGFSGVTGRDLANRSLLETDEIAVGEIVLGSEAIRRVDEKRGHEGDGGERNEPMPAPDAAAKRGNAEENHEREKRQQVAGEQRASHCRKEEEIGDNNDEEGAAILAREWRLSRCAGLGKRVKEQARQREQYGNKQVHVQGELVDAVPEGDEEAQ